MFSYSPSEYAKEQSGKALHCVAANNCVYIEQDFASRQFSTTKLGWQTEAIRLFCNNTDICLCRGKDMDLFKCGIRLEFRVTDSVSK